MAEHERHVMDFLRSVSTATRFMDFATERQLEDWPPDAAGHVMELEDILSRLSLEAEALIARVRQGGNHG